jgi:hypothetical protein
MKLRRVDLAGHVACMGEMRNAYRIVVENQKGRDHLEDLGIDGKIILEWILWETGWMVWTGCIWHGIGTNGRLL